MRESTLKMDKNSLIGITLIALILFGFSYWMRPSAEQIERARRQRDSLEQVMQERNAARQKELQEQRAFAADPAMASLPDTLPDSLRDVRLRDQYGVFYRAVEGTRETVTLENERMQVDFSTRGGRPYRVVLKEYMRYDSTALVLFDGDSTIFGLNFFAQNRAVSTDRLYFEPLPETTADGKVLRMRLYAADDAYLDYVYTMRPDDYMMDFRIEAVNMNRYIEANQSTIDFEWQIYVPRQEKGADNENNYTSIHYKYLNEDGIEDFSPTKTSQTEKASTRLSWIAFKQQFFTSVLLADEHFANAEISSEKTATFERYLKKYHAAIGIPYNAQETSVTVPMRLYFGPIHYKTLKKYRVDLEKLVPLGGSLVSWINKYVIIVIFDWLNSFISNYGLIILIMTVLIKLVLLPLTYKTYMSTAKTKVLKPFLDEINKKFPADKAMERQQATMELYKKAGINPMGGCLPMLIQFPILIAMFRFFPSSIELRQQAFLWADDLSTYDSILNLPFSIPFYGDHVSLFTLLMTIATIVSMKMSSGQSDSSMPGMKMMMYMMPVMFLFLLNNFSSALTYYYLLANLITIGQNYFFSKTIDEGEILRRVQAASASPGKGGKPAKSKFQQKLEQMAKERGIQLPKR